MKRTLLTFFMAIVTLMATGHTGSDEYPANYAKEPRFRLLICYDPSAEPDHVTFDRQAIDFFHKLSYGEGFLYDVAESLDDYPYERLKEYSAVVMLNAQPSKERRDDFRKYMENGGGWIGFHAAAFNNADTAWPWLNEFLGCGEFLCNNWPPQPAQVRCDVTDHAVTRTLPEVFIVHASEFYQWSPSPRKDKDVRILLSITPANYPFGIKDVVTGGDFPIVWTNTRYRMIYLNMGHGDQEFIDATQNLLFVNAFRWLISTDPAGNPFEK